MRTAQAPSQPVVVEVAGLARTLRTCLDVVVVRSMAAVKIARLGSACLDGGGHQRY
jgi:hypothetical protein